MKIEQWNRKTKQGHWRVMECIFGVSGCWGSVGGLGDCKERNAKTRNGSLSVVVPHLPVAIQFLRFWQSQKLGKRKHTPPCSSAHLFFAEKKWGPQRKNFGGRYGCLGFCRVFVSTTGLDSFSLRPEKFPKWFSLENPLFLVQTGHKQASIIWHLKRLKMMEDDWNQPKISNCLKVHENVAESHWNCQQRYWASEI